MSNFVLIKVKVCLPQNIHEAYFRRQSTVRKDGCFKNFFDDLVQRYELLKSAILKITWIDNDGDKIRIFNEDDFLTFMEWKGKTISVNVAEVDLSRSPNDEWCIVEPCINLIVSRNEEETSKVHENERIKNNSIGLRLKLQELVKDAGDSYYPDKQLLAVTELRKIVSSGPPYVDDLSSSDLKILVKCLEQTNHSKLQLQAAWTLTNIAAGTSEETKRVVEAGAVPILIRLLASSDPNVCEQALWALGNIIGDGPNLRDDVIKHGIIQLLLKLIETKNSTSLLRKIAIVARNLCPTKSPPPKQIIIDIMPVLNMLIQQKDVEILDDTVWTLSNIALIGKEQIQMILDYGFVPKIMLLLDHVDVKLLVAALNAIGNIAAGTDEQTQVILNCGALSYFHRLLQNPDEKIRKKVVWILSNIAGGTQSQIQAVIEAGLLPEIIMNMRIGEDGTKIDAAWTISNIANRGNRKQIAQLIKEGALPPLCTILTISDDQNLIVVLKGIKNILKMAGRYVGHIADIIEECNGLEKIKELQKHENIEIFKLAEDIIKELFPDDVDELKRTETNK